MWLGWGEEPEVRCRALTCQCQSPVPSHQTRRVGSQVQGLALRNVVGADTNQVSHTPEHSDVRCLTGLVSCV